MLHLLLNLVLLPSDSQGRAVAENIGAHSFYECSALTGEGVKGVFEGAGRASLIEKVKRRKRTICVIA